MDSGGTRSGGYWLGWALPIAFAVLLATCWLASFYGGGIGVAAWILISALWPLVGGGVLAAIGVRSVIKRRLSAANVTGVFVAVFAIWPATWSLGAPGVAYPARSLSAGPAIVVRIPSDQALRVLWGGPAYARNRHATSPGQRWAYDLANDPLLTGAKHLNDYGCFGALILAPANGLVHLAHDGERDLAIGESLADPRKLLGNHVVLKLEDETFLILAHLREGSVRVKRGAAVSAGEPLGECGNSGNSSEPHIHLHRQRQDPLLFDGDLNLGVNYVEGLPLHFATSRGVLMPKGGIRVRGTQAVPTGDLIIPAS